MKSKMCLTCPDGPLLPGARSRWDRCCEVAKKPVRGMDVCPKTGTRKPRKREIARKAREERRRHEDGGQEEV